MKIETSKCSVADFDCELAVNMWKETIVLFFHVIDISDMHKFNYAYTVKLCV